MGAPDVLNTSEIHSTLPPLNTHNLPKRIFERVQLLTFSDERYRIQDSHLSLFVNACNKGASIGFLTPRYHKYTPPLA
jgi:hypothetical protein